MSMPDARRVASARAATAERAGGRPLTVLHVTSHVHPGGITSYITSVSMEMAARGHRVIVASGGGSMEPHLAARGVEHWTLPLNTSAEASPQVWAAALRLWWRLRRRPVDVLHAHTRVGQVVAWWLAEALRRPYITTWHGFFRRRWFRRVLPCTGQRTIAISQPVADHLRDVFDVPTDRTRLILHGIDVSRFGSAVDAARRSAIRRSLGLPEGGLVVGTMTRLVPSKGVDLLLNAFGQVQQRRPALRLLIVGDGEDRTRLERLVADAKLTSAVRFIGAVEDSAPALAAMDVFVFLPAEAEGFGLSLLEAMAAGVPIVGVRRGQGAAWVLDQSQAGVIVPPGDPEALAEGIEKLITNRALATTLAQAARTVVEERYSLGRMVDQIEGVYREAIEEHASSA